MKYVLFLMMVGSSCMAAEIHLLKPYNEYFPFAGEGPILLQVEIVSESKTDSGDVVKNSYNCNIFGDLDMIFDKQHCVPFVITDCSLSFKLPATVTLMRGKKIDDKGLKYDILDGIRIRK